MAYNRLVLSGTLAAGLEQFSVGVNFINDLGPLIIDPNDLNLWAEQAFAAWQALLAPNLKTGLSSSGAMTSFKAYYYASNSGPATTVGEYVDSEAGTGAALHPLPTAFVVSLRTPLAGRRTRGRFYWPALGTSVTTAGFFTSTFLAAAPTEARNLLVALAEAAPGTSDLTPAVVSKTGGTVTAVTSVAVGNVPDTQRRRRNGLQETYGTASI